MCRGARQNVLNPLKREILVHQARSTHSSQKTRCLRKTKKTSFNPFHGKADIKRLIYGDTLYITNLTLPVL